MKVWLPGALAGCAVWTCFCGQKHKHICFIVPLRADWRLFFFSSRMPAVSLRKRGSEIVLGNGLKIVSEGSAVVVRLGWN